MRPSPSLQSPVSFSSPQLPIYCCCVVVLMLVDVVVVLWWLAEEQVEISRRHYHQSPFSSSYYAAWLVWYCVHMLLWPSLDVGCLVCVCVVVGDSRQNSGGKKFRKKT